MRPHRPKNRSFSHGDGDRAFLDAARKGMASNRDGDDREGRRLSGPLSPLRQGRKERGIMTCQAGTSDLIHSSAE
jgi:hypothetical protein